MSCVLVSSLLCLGAWKTSYSRLLLVQKKKEASHCVSPESVVASRNAANVYVERNYFSCSVCRILQFLTVFFSSVHNSLRYLLFCMIFSSFLFFAFYTIMRLSPPSFFSFFWYLGLFLLSCNTENYFIRKTDFVVNVQRLMLFSGRQ